VRNKSFWSSFLQKARRFQRQRLWALTAVSEILLSSGAFSGVRKELCSVAAGNFAQSFMGKKSKLLIENLFSIPFSAREKVLESRLQAESDLKNYPVDDF